jgi:hypothetical protein
MRRFATTWVPLAGTLLVAARQALAQGCAMCGNSFAPDDPAVQAMNTSVIFLLLTPYTLLAAVGGWLYLRYRRAGSHRRATVIALPWVRARVAPGRAPEEE